MTSSELSVDPSAVLSAAEQLAPAVASNVEAARKRVVAAGGDPDQIAIVAVTKTLGPSAPLAALLAGLHDVGENYAAELLEKAPVVDAAAHLAGLASPRWHFLGGIQRNKVGRLCPVVSCWQGLARVEEAASIARHRSARRDGAPQAFVEVNVAGDPGRAGCALEDVPGLVTAAQEGGLAVRGLMAVAPLAEGGAEHAFRTVADLADELGLSELSLGMSGDFEAAVAAGSTMIRLGAALFGPRKPGNGPRGL